MGRDTRWSHVRRRCVGVEAGDIRLMCRPTHNMRSMYVERRGIRHTAIRGARASRSGPACDVSVCACVHGLRAPRRGDRAGLGPARVGSARAGAVACPETADAGGSHGEGRESRRTPRVYKYIVVDKLLAQQALNHTPILHLHHQYRAQFVARQRVCNSNPEHESIDPHSATACRLAHRARASTKITRPNQTSLPRTPHCRRQALQYLPRCPVR